MKSIRLCESTLPALFTGFQIVREMGNKRGKVSSKTLHALAEATHKKRGETQF